MDYRGQKLIQQQDACNTLINEIDRLKKSLDDYAEEIRANWDSKGYDGSGAKRAAVKRRMVDFKLTATELVREMYK